MWSSRTKIGVVLGLTLVGLTIGACGRNRGFLNNAVSPPPGATGPESGWSNPPENTDRVATFDEAAAKTGFPVKTPRNMGSPIGIYVWKCDDPAVCSRQVIAVYSQNTLGYVWIGERLDNRTTAQWSTWASTEVQTNNEAAARALPGAPDSGGGEEIATIRGGVQALVQWHADSNAGAQINWREGSVEWSIATQLAGRDDAIGLANKV